MFEKVIKTIPLPGGQEVKIWVNPSIRVLRMFGSGKEKDFREAIAAILCTDPKDLPETEDWPPALYGNLIGTKDIKGRIWTEIEAYNQEVVRNFGGGSESTSKE